MSEWKDRPDGDGLWWFQGRGGICLYTVSFDDSKALQVSGYNGKVCVYSATYDLANYKGKWQRCIATPPAPYVPPQPPKVEQYTAKFRKDGSLRFLVKVGSSFIATTEHGEVCGGRYWGGSDMELYTDIQPCEQASTK